MRAEFFPFRTIADQFHMIDSTTQTIYIPCQDGATLVERLRTGEHNKNLCRQLGRDSVAVYEKHFTALQQAGDLEILPDGTAILCDPSLYSEQIGLSLDADSRKVLFL